MANLQPICDFLRASKVADLIREQSETPPVVVLHEKMTLRRALMALAHREILSAPVITSEHEHLHPEKTVEFQYHADGDVLGFLDLRDVLCGFLKHCDSDRVLAMPTLARMQWLEEQGAVFCDKLVSTMHALERSDGNFLHDRQTKLSVWELVFSSLLHPDRTARGGRTCGVHHRMALFNSQYQLTQIISQTDIIRHLHKHKHKVMDCLQVQLSDLPELCSKHMVSMEVTKSAFEALTLMAKHDISAVPVTGRDGKLIGDFSMSEMRSIMAEHFGALALPVSEFLVLAEGMSYAAGDSAGSGSLSSAAVDFARSRRQIRAMRTTASEAGEPVAFLQQAATIEDVLDALVAQRVHRVYVVNADLQPWGVVTMTDLLHAIGGETPPGILNASSNEPQR